METKEYLYKHELIAVFKILGYLIFGGFSIWIMSFVIDLLGNSFYNIIYVLGYIILLIITGYLESKYVSSFWKISHLLMMIPIASIVLLVFALPILLLIIQIVFFFAFVNIIPQILLEINNYFRFLNLSHEQSIFFELLTTTLIAFSFCPFILFLVNKVISFSLKNSKKQKWLLSFMVNNSKLWLNRSNVRALIYGFYFCFLVYYSYLYLNKNTTFENSSVENAVLYSFLCFLGFESALTNLNRISFKPSILEYKLHEVLFKRDSIKKNNFPKF